MCFAEGIRMSCVFYSDKDHWDHGASKESMNIQLEQGVIFSVPLMLHDPSDLGSLVDADMEHHKGKHGTSS